MDGCAHDSNSRGRHIWILFGWKMVQKEAGQEMGDGPTLKAPCRFHAVPAEVHLKDCAICHLLWSNYV